MTGNFQKHIEVAKGEKVPSIGGGGLCRICLAIMPPIHEFLIALETISIDDATTNNILVVDDGLRRHVDLGSILQIAIASFLASSQF